MRCTGNALAQGVLPGYSGVMEKTHLAEASFSRLLGIIARLRGEGGCPWDRAQTPESMRADLIEETFEAVDAISAGDSAHAREELGDVLLNALLIVYMYEQAGAFAVADTLDALAEKLVRRHPHVFSESEAHAFLRGGKQADAPQSELSPDEVLSQWDAIKHGLEKRRGDSALDEVPAGFPPLLKALKVQKKAAKAGFDWDSPDGALRKIGEELAEAEAARAALPQTGGEKPFAAHASPAQNEAQLFLEEEIGDLLFSVVNWARHLRVDPSTALSRANAKFERRFRFVEKECAASGREMKTLSLKELDAYWEQAKALPVPRTGNG